MSTPTESVLPQTPARAGATTPRQLGRAANWTVGLAAAALVLVSAGGYFYHREQLSAIAAEHLRLIVTGPSRLQTGVAAEYLISTTSISGLPLPAQIEVSILGPDGKRLKAYKEPADDRGRLQVVIPADLSLSPQATLKVMAWHHERREEAEIPLPVEPIRYRTQLVIDKPLHQPGDTVQYRSLTLSEFTLAADREMPVHFEVFGPNGVAVPQSVSDTLTKRGVASGSFTIPRDTAKNAYTVTVRSPDVAFSEQQQTFLVLSPHAQERTRDTSTESDSGRDANSALPKDSAKTDVTFYPEGGGLASGLENRVYFRSSDARGKPVALTGTIVVEAPADGKRDGLIAQIETRFQGMGSFSIMPRAGEKYRLKITSPGDVADKTLPEVLPDREVVLTTGVGVFPAGKPLEFHIRSTRAGLPLIVAAYCRGVQVGQQPLVTRAGSGGINPVAIPLDNAADGVIRLAVHDYSTTPPKLAAQRLIYRRPARKLDVRVTGQKERYAPGESVNLSLLATSEKGAPVPAVLSAAVGSNELPSLFGKAMPTLPAYFLLTSQIGMPVGLEQPDFYLSDEERDKVSGAAALDLLLGTQTPPEDGEMPPAMVDNLAQIRSDYEKSFADYRAVRTEALNTLTTASFFGGLGLVVLVAMLGLMRIVSGIHLWAATIGATTCSLIIGAILMDPSRLAVSPNVAAAFSSYHAATPKAAAPSDRETLRVEVRGPARISVTNVDEVTVTDKPGAKQDLGKTAYWNPLLIADADGKASIQFKLPESAGTYQLTVDAHDQGRLGSNRADIVVRREPSNSN